VWARAAAGKVGFTGTYAVAEVLDALVEDVEEEEDVDEETLTEPELVELDELPPPPSHPDRPPTRAKARRTETPHPDRPLERRLDPTSPPTLGTGPQARHVLDNTSLNDPARSRHRKRHLSTAPTGDHTVAGSASP
jgi:hypothetical protein